MKQTWRIWFQDRLFRFPPYFRKIVKNECLLFDGRTAILVSCCTEGAGVGFKQHSRVRGKEAPTPNHSKPVLRPLSNFDAVVGSV